MQIHAFMLEIMEVKDAAMRLQCLAFQKRFPVAQREICGRVSVVEAACDDVKMSRHLKKLFAIILQLGNKLNAGSHEVRLSFYPLLPAAA